MCKDSLYVLYTRFIFSDGGFQGQESMRVYRCAGLMRSMWSIKCH